MLAIKNNLMAENAARHLGQSYSSLSKSVERLSSGLRINSAKDDAAGLAVRELIRADVAQIRQASRNAQDGISMLQTAEGALGVMDNVLVRMKELSEQAATGSYSLEQRQIMNQEYTQLAQEVTRIATSTKFNGTSILDGSTSSVAIHLGSGAISFSTSDMRATKINSGNDLNSSAATKESATWNRTVASASDNYLFANEVDATHKLIKVAFADDLNAGVTLDLTALSGKNYSGTGISLNQLVEELNKASTGKYTASSVYTENKGWSLKIEALTAGHDTAGNGVLVSNAMSVGTGANDVSQFAAAGFGANAAHTAGDLSSSIDLTTVGGAAGALTAVANAIETKDKYRAQLGYMMNRLESGVSILDIQAENLSTAESRISDVDVATEMAAMTRNQVLAQAGISMLAQANQMPQMALKLLG